MANSRRIVIGNWKMHGARAMLDGLGPMDDAAAALPDVDVGLAPPFTLIGAMATRLRHIAVGGQDCHARASGAHTGDVAPAMLVDSGASFVILGHSERRAHRDDAGMGHGESDAMIRAKGEAALGAGLRVVLCLGETLAERQNGQAQAVVAEQLRASMPRVPGALVIAYEPVWSIGTGLVPNADDIAAMHALIARTLDEEGVQAAILYGGSVNADNAGSLAGIAGVDGFLVGGASLKADDFITIMRALG